MSDRRTTVELKELLNDELPNLEDAADAILAEKEENRKSAERRGTIVWRGANAVMTTFFLMAAGVQFNDPDPFLWVPLYGIACVLTAAITVRPQLCTAKPWRWAYWTHTAFCLGMLVYVLVELLTAFASPNSDGSLNPLTYEEGREMAGIMITIVWLFTCKQSPTIRSNSSNTKLKKNQQQCHHAVMMFSLLVLSLFPLLVWGLCYSDVMNSTYFSVCSDFYVDEFCF